MPKKHNPGCLCCGCPILVDGFDRDDGTDLGANWTETTGSWSIESGAAKSTGTATLTPTLATEAGQNCTLTCRVKGDTDDDVVTLGSGMFAVDVSFGAGGYISAFGGVVNRPFTFTLNQWFTIRVDYCEGFAKIYVDDVLVIISTALNSETVAGILAPPLILPGAVGNVWFDDYDFSAYSDADNTIEAKRHPGCPTCSAPACAILSLATSITMEIEGYTEWPGFGFCATGCDSYNGEYVFTNQGGCVWEVSGLSLGSSDTDCHEYTRITLEYDAGGESFPIKWYDESDTLAHSSLFALSLGALPVYDGVATWIDTSPPPSGGCSLSGGTITWFLSGISPAGPSVPSQWLDTWGVEFFGEWL